MHRRRSKSCRAEDDTAEKRGVVVAIVLHVEDVCQRNVCMITYMPQYAIQNAQSAAETMSKGEVTG
jgi:hypothetical protein